MIRSTAFGLAAAALVWAAAVPASARPLDDVKASGRLIVALYYDNAPFSWEDPKTGQAKGIEADLARAVAKELGLEAQILVRMAGESSDDDVRSNIWQGPRTGGLKADIMFHVPIDREFVARNQEAMLSNPYHHEQIVVAVHPDLVDVADGLAAFAKQKIAVRFSTAGHYLLTFADGGAYKTNVSPYFEFTDAVKAFKAREVAALMGTRSDIEAALAGSGIETASMEPTFPDTLIGAWNVGTAVHTDGRDVGYAVGRILSQMRTSGEMARIFASHGVTHVPPPVRR